MVAGIGLFGMAIDRNRPAIAYGPGRYDPVYKEGNIDYPVGYVR